CVGRARRRHPGGAARVAARHVCNGNPRGGRYCGHGRLIPGSRLGTTCLPSEAKAATAIMETEMKVVRLLVGAGVGWGLCGARALAADYPAPKEGDFVAREFRFHTGEVMPELRLHSTTIGAPSGEPVLILHGTTGSGASLLPPGFAGELFGPGQPL